jgi:hypothetical protein
MKSWALVVGVNEYPAPTGMNRLFGAVADAADFADWALHPNGGNVSPEGLYFWTCPAPPTPSSALKEYLESPTGWKFPGTPDLTRPPDFRDIVATASSLAQAAQGAQIGRIYVFFAGHGVQTISLDVQREPQTCFLTNDFRPGPPTAGLVPCEDLRRGLLASGFSEVIMFLDCCRTPMNFNEAAPSLGWNIAAIPDASYGVGRAAKRGAKAFEAPEAAPTRGAFSQVLVEGLRRRRNDQNQLTLNDLENYVSTGVHSILGNGKQYPQFDIEPRNPPYSLLIAPAISQQVPIVVSFTTLPAGVAVQLTGSDGRPVGVPLIAGPNPIAVDAEVGTVYSLETPDHTFVKTFKHDGPGATHVDL